MIKTAREYLGYVYVQRIWQVRKQHIHGTVYGTFSEYP